MAPPVRPRLSVKMLRSAPPYCSGMVVGFDAPEAHRIVATGWAEAVGWPLDEQLAQAAQQALEDHVVCDTTVAGFEHPACYYSNTGAWGQMFATHAAERRKL